MTDNEHAHLHVARQGPFSERSGGVHPACLESTNHLKSPHTQIRIGPAMQTTPPQEKSPLPQPDRLENGPCRRHPDIARRMAGPWAGTDLRAVRRCASRMSQIRKPSQSPHTQTRVGPASKRHNPKKNRFCPSRTVWKTVPANVTRGIARRMAYRHPNIARRMADEIARHP